MSATDDEARRTYLISIRERLGYTQTVMGGSLGLSLRAYNAIETGSSPCRKIHILAAERVLLHAAAQRSASDLLNPPLAKDVKSLHNKTSADEIIGPFVREISHDRGRSRYIVVRYLRNDKGGLDTQAMSVAGTWVDRPEGFDADPEVTFYDKDPFE